MDAEASCGGTAPEQNLDLSLDAGVLLPLFQLKVVANSRGRKRIFGGDEFHSVEAKNNFTLDDPKSVR